MSSQSSTTGNILGAIGAVVGGIYGGPVGAAQGYAIGSSIGNMLDPPKGPTQTGPRLEDKSVQTSTYGATIPRVYGTCKVAGNIFWLEKDQLKETVKKESSGGKGGGGGTEIKTYTYSATFAVGLCKGPIAGIRRIWVGPNLIYDAQSDDLETIIAGNQNISDIEIYTGTEDQQPCSRMQADKGVANTPAYRGMAYVVFKDFQLAKYGNSLAQAQVNVEIVKNLDQKVSTLFYASADESPSTVEISGRPANYQRGFTYATALGGPSALYRLSRDGATRQVGIPPEIDMAEWSAQSNAMCGLDINDFVFPSVSGTESLLFVSGDKFTTKSTSFDLSDLRYHERGSHMWVRFSADANKPGAPTFGGWIASVSESLGQLSYDSRFSISGINDKHVATPDGLIIKYSATIPPSTVGAIGIGAYDKSGALAYSFAVNVQPALISRDSLLSSAYVDDNMVAHFVFALYSTPSPNPAEFGKFFYAQVDLESKQLKRQAEVYFPGMVSAGHATPEMCYEEDGVLYVGATAQSGKNLYCSFSHSAIDQNGVPLSEIVSDECFLSGLLEVSDVDAASLDDTVNGYRVSSVGSIRNGIEPLRGAWPFDVLQDGYQVRFRERGTESVATIDIGDLAASEQLRESREMDSQIARKVVVKYLDSARDYDANEQSDQRENTEAVNTLSMDLPVVLTATEAKRVAQKLLYLYWLERSDFSFKLPPDSHYLQPSDVVTIVDDQASYTLRISTIKYNDDGSLDCTAKPNNAAVYTSIADTDGGLIPPVTIPLPGDSIGLLMDIPVIDETLQNTTGFVGYMTGETAGWPGGVHWVTPDNGQTWGDLQGYIGKGTFGTVTGALSANPGQLIQKGGSITVDLYSGSLSGITEDQMKNGRNYAAYGAAGRWEIIRFQNATLNADGSYTLDTFIRGDRGTEWATGLHLSGDTFCLLDDPDGAFILTNTASIGVPRTVRAVTSGADIDAAQDESFTYNGVNLECYSPVNGLGSRDGSDNLSIAWTRRTRIGGEWRSNVDANLGESTEAYEIDIMSGATVKRTINSATQSATYSAADQTTDFGSPQASVTVRIYQMSAIVGRGYPLEVTL